MLEFSPQVISRFEEDAARRYCAKARNWLLAQPELSRVANRISEEFCMDSLMTARAQGIVEEDDVARWARLRLLHGDDWLASDGARAILESNRNGTVKVFQLGCLAPAAAHG